ncbi:magnesium transporter CorA family protein [Acetobacter sp. TBRC 12305]|uniref:Magnesium transporter CorA family protein n=1 Tax=Acetobacter garciniae TaxID=2817435 RepID=A0A939HPK6_9PROT|nr:magnesium transporter CorA family protein [Acetobacter garciniae]MBO1324946.1 magnesium transporter CorA family protein [Acetobacter garciniae]MBX0344637.1 magnesium transporter CorA family protein [Acetobacter garciniae]
MPAQAVQTPNDAEGCVWLDLLDPTPQEQALAEQLCGQPLPTLADLNAIESSSRISVRKGAAFLSSPLLKKTGTEFQTMPVGFILTEDRLFTIRFQSYQAFEAVTQLVAEQAPAMPAMPATGAAAGSVIAPPHGVVFHASEILVTLIETIVDRLADILESVGDLLDTLSHDIFRQRPQTRVKRNIASWQRDLLQRVGSSGSLCSRMRDTLLGLERIALFLSESRKAAAAAPAPGSAMPVLSVGTRRITPATPGEEEIGPAAYTLPGALRARIATVSRDLSSLDAYLSQAQDKVEFLLDATLGFINIEQNGVMKVLTVVSFIGVAPTLVAGIYGMNFRNIPELNWAFGYWYALGLMGATTVLPLLWFWKKGWLGGIS